MRQIAAMAGTLAALLALPAAPAAAQLYKWVDARGVVNYSSQPPDASEAKGPVQSVQDTVSVYSPDAELVREMARGRKSARRPATPAPAAPETPSVVMLGGTPPTPPPPVEEGYTVYYPVAGFPHAHRRHRDPFPPTRYFLPKPDEVKSAPPVHVKRKPGAGEGARARVAPPSSGRSHHGSRDFERFR